MTKILRSFLIAIFFISSNLYAQIGVKHYSFNDATRNKKISVTCWYPANANDKGEIPKGIWKQNEMISDAPINLQAATARNGKLPLVVISHGYQSSPDSLSWLASDLVKHGFIVVAIQHQDVSVDNKPYMEHWQRAIDVSVMLKDLQQASMSNNIDFSRIGFAGYSLGTSTGLWLAGGIASTYERTVNPGRQFAPADEFPDLDSENADYLLHHTDFKAAKKNYRDPLIKSVFLMAPGYGWAFDAKHLADITIPFFLVAAEKDEMLYPETNAYYFSKYIPNSEMKIMPDIGHFIFLNQTKEAASADLTAEEKKHIVLLKQLGQYQYSDEEREKVQQEVGNLAVNFFLATLK